ncbi:MAG: FAD:protein FMN transferase [Bacteroidales bacterium]|nr:FAD:protein FMN transferase [Bacteroidales bacterium]
MKKKGLLILSLILLTAGCAQRDRYVAISGYAQGGTYTVKVNLAGVRERPEAIKASVDSILRAVDFSVSGYNSESLLSRFNAGEAIVPDAIFADLYNISRRLYDETGGALNVAAGPLFDIWGFGFTTDSLPSTDHIREALALCDMSALPDSIRAGEAIDGRGLHRPGSGLSVSGQGVRLNFNAIAQGYSCDLVAAYLRGIGIRDMLVDIGEIFLEGRNPSGQGWAIGVDKPIDGNNTPGAQIDSVIRSDGGAHGIVTSGNYRKFYIRDGRKYAHTIDPRTGYPVQHQLLSATVIAPTATLADAYATYCMVIGPEAARSFIGSRPDLDAYLICGD